MSKFGFHIGANHPGLTPLFQQTVAQHSPIPIVFSLDQNISSTRNEYSPTTKIVYRDQRFGPDNGAMYQGTVEEAHLAGHAWAERLIPVWRLNPADWYAPINEPGLHTVAAYQWLAAFFMGCMDEAQAAGLKLCVGEWSTGNPKLDADSIAALVPMLRQAADNGHILGLHEYSLTGPLITTPPNPLILRYRQLYALLPEDAKPQLVISECGPGGGYGTGGPNGGYVMQAYVDVMGAYDLELMNDRYVLGGCAFNYGGNESNLSPAIPLITTWIVDHPTPTQPTLYERVAYLEQQDRTNTVAHQQLQIEHTQLTAQVADLMLRVQALEQQEPAGRAPGIDVSHYQGAIDWNKVKQDGQSFAFIKATEAANFKDQRFIENWNNAKVFGLLRGAYHFYRFNTSPQAQAQWFLAALGSDHGELPPVVDVEDTATAPNATALKTFIDLISTAIGRKPIIYTASWWWNNTRWGSPITWAKDYDLWVANYNVAAPTLPTDWTAWKFWQKSSTGSVNGIAGNVDLDQFNGALSDLKAYAKQITPEPPPTPEPITHAVPIGLHMRADGEDHNAAYFALELQCLDAAKVKAVKVQTNSTFESFDAMLARGSVAANCVLRLYAAGNNPSLTNPDQFFSEQSAWLARFRDKGGIFVEVHNEPNLDVEGMHHAWASPAAFGGFFDSVARSIHTNYPTLKVGFPGLAPKGDNVAGVPDADFMAIIQASLSSGTADWVGVHAYWQHAGSGAGGMDSIEDGRHYRKYLGLSEAGFPPLLILTEFANVATTDSDAVKGQQYKAYYAALEPQVLGAFAFCSSATDPAFNTSRQTWIRSNALTDVPREVGK
jgi:GH25 family lysozyme M1 (1,4-beta-N-acetylmuramidase)